MSRITFAALTLASALCFTGCESPDAFPYDPNGPTASTQPAPADPAVAFSHQETATISDISALQGEWAMVSLIKDGKTVMSGESQPGKLMVTGKRFILLGASAVGNMSAGSLSIDATQSPKSITLVADAKEADGKARFGIYDFPDSPDFLRICIPEPGVRKPDGFGPGKGVSILVFKKTQSVSAPRVPR